MNRERRGVVRSAPVAAALLAALGFAVGASAAADVEDEYKQGLVAVEKNDWTVAAQHLEAAIAERPKESARLLRYLYFHPYLPHYYLGIARAELGDCRTALVEWAESEGQGVIAGRDEYADLKARRARCEETVSAAEAAAARAAAAVERAAAAAADLADLAAGAEMEALWHEGEPSFAGRQEEAERKLQAARESLAGAKESLDGGAARAAEVLAGEARNLFAAVDRDARRRRDEVRQHRQARREDFERQRAAAAELLAGMADLEPYPPRIHADRTEVEKLLAEGEALDPSTRPVDLEQLGERLGEALGRLRAAIAPPPQELRAAATAYFAGDYGRTLELLAGTPFRDRRSAAHAFLLRAAAGFALAAGGGVGGDGEGARLLDHARQDAVACHQADPSLDPPAKFYSPRFVAFFKESVAAGGG